MQKFIYIFLLSVLFCANITFAQTKRALLIGISDYGYAGKPDTWGNIHGANDVNLIYPTLKNKGFVITKICDQYATAKNIRAEFRKLNSSSKKGDYVYIHFSGHGQPFEDTNGDEEDGWDESIIPYDAQVKYIKGKYEGNNHIKDDELNKYIQNIRKKVGKKGFVFVVIDACHSGSSFMGDEEEASVRGTNKGFTMTGREYRPRLNTKGNFSIKASDNLANIIILEACRSYQSNYEIKENGIYYGPLSFYLNKTIESISISSVLQIINKVKEFMSEDKRLVRQNMVYETSIK